MLLATDHSYNDLYQYDIDMEVWTDLFQLGSVPVGRALHGFLSVSDDLYVFGGLDVNGVSCHQHSHTCTLVNNLFTILFQNKMLHTSMSLTWNVRLCVERSFVLLPHIHEPGRNLARRPTYV